MKKFDVIIGNPPFQSGNGNGSKPIYRDFVLKSLELLSINGFISMVTPPGIYNTSDIEKKSESFDKLSSIDLFEINLDISEFFPKVGTPISYFCAINRSYQGITKISNEYIDISNDKFIPRVFNSNIKYIIHKVIYQTNLNTINTKYRKPKNIKKYRVCFKELNHISNKVGNIKPVILNPGQVEDTTYHFCKEVETLIEAQSLHSFLNSKLISFFNFIVRYNNVFHNNVIGKIKIPTLDKIYSDSEIYDIFDINDEYIKIIENYVK